MHQLYQQFTVTNGVSDVDGLTIINLYTQLNHNMDLGYSVPVVQLCQAYKETLWGAWGCFGVDVGDSTNASSIQLTWIRTDVAVHYLGGFSKGSLRSHSWFGASCQKQKRSWSGGGWISTSPDGSQLNQLRIVYPLLFGITIVETPGALA